MAPAAASVKNVGGWGTKLQFSHTQIMSAQHFTFAPKFPQEGQNGGPTDPNIVFLQENFLTG